MRSINGKQKEKSNCICTDAHDLLLTTVRAKERLQLSNANLPFNTINTATCKSVCLRLERLFEGIGFLLTCLPQRVVVVPSSGIVGASVSGQSLFCTIKRTRELIEEPFVSKSAQDRQNRNIETPTTHLVNFEFRTFIYKMLQCEIGLKVDSSSAYGIKSDSFFYPSSAAGSLTLPCSLCTSTSDVICCVDDAGDELDDASLNGVCGLIKNVHV